MSTGTDPVRICADEGERAPYSRPLVLKLLDFSADSRRHMYEMPADADQPRCPGSKRSPGLTSNAGL